MTGSFPLRALAPEGVAALVAGEAGIRERPGSLNGGLEIAV
jgi:hypothetical protein